VTYSQAAQIIASLFLASAAAFAAGYMVGRWRR
jgi:hypothetical protein